ncbi:MAG: polysaccharide biosynthesis/export family protein [Pyrinomonadaceae bacterium]
MKAVKINLSLILVLILGSILAVTAFAQNETSNKEPEKIAKAEKQDDQKDAGNNVAPKSSDPNDVQDDDDDTEVVVNQYKNYLSEYRMGPNDIISIEVFGQCPDYCRTDITVGPTARVSYPLIREGVFVGGRTVTEVADDVTKKLDEYIIDPKVTVTLVRAGSARYAVMGKVATPGERIMDRSVTLYEAIMGAGGVVKGGEKKEVILARINLQGFLERKLVNLEDIERGKIPTPVLQPGDQVIVPGKGFTWQKFLNVVTQISGFRGLVGRPY